MTLNLTVKFEKGESSVTLPAPEPGSRIREVRHQGLGLTAGGVRYAYDKGVTRYEAELEFRSLSAAGKEALVEFFDSAACGVTETFTYTDSGGAGYTARLLESSLEAAKLAPEVWDVRLKLELSAMGA